MVGSSPSEPQQPPTVVGGVTHLVARLQQLAAPGTLLGSEDTLQLVHGEGRSAACGSVAIQDGRSRSRPTRSMRWGRGVCPWAGKPGAL